MICLVARISGESKLFLMKKYVAHKYSEHLLFMGTKKVTRSMILLILQLNFTFYSIR